MNNMVKVFFGAKGFFKAGFGGQTGNDGGFAMLLHDSCPEMRE